MEVENEVGGAGLFDNARDEEESVPLFGGGSQGDLGIKTGLGKVGSGDVGKREGVGGGLDLGDVHRTELLDVTEDLMELGTQTLFFVGSEGQSGEVGHVMNVERIGRHGRRINRRRTGWKGGDAIAGDGGWTWAKPTPP